MRTEQGTVYVGSALVPALARPGARHEIRAETQAAQGQRGNINCSRDLGEGLSKEGQRACITLRSLKGKVWEGTRGTLKSGASELRGVVGSPAHVGLNWVSWSLRRSHI